MKKLIIGLSIFLLLGSSFAMAQEAPTPHRSPRVPVKRQAIVTHKDVVAQSREVQGTATIIDGEKLRIADVDLRLFGIVPPQLSASFGPQARMALDSLAANQNVTCQIRDRDHDGRFLATCKTPNNTDMALELLRRGLAVTARGSLGTTDLATPYLAAEQTAQTQKIGLWSVVVSTPAASAPAPAPTPVAALPTPPTPSTATPTTEAKKDEKQSKADKLAAQSASSVPPVAASALQPPHEETHSFDDETPGFFVRYQILLTGFVMLATALGILGALSIQRRAERRDEMKAIAAALRGELMAARAVCQTRLKNIVTDADDKNTTWPRIRTTLYQAYVGRLGWLGAELARQVASIYGQTSDYVAYFNDEARSLLPKRQALETLTSYIEEVLPKLAVIEQTGQRPAMQSKTQAWSPAPRPVTAPLIESTAVETTPTLPKADITPPQAVPPVVEPAAPAEAPTTEATTEAAEKAETSPIPLWNKMRKFAREHLGEKHNESAEDFEPDYTMLIEEEIASLSFSDSSEEASSNPDQATKLRDAG